MEKLQKYLPTPLILLSFIVSFLTIYANGAPILQDPDMGWHIITGDLIRSCLCIPAHDTWSFSGSDQIWYNVSWLWDLVLSIVHQIGGVKGMYVFTNALPALLVALLLSSVHKRGGVGINALIFIGMISTYCLFEFATGRPQVAGMFFALFFHNILHESRNHPNSWKLWLLPLMMVLWVNIHGSFFVGFIVLGAYGLEALYSTIKLNIDQRKWFVRLFIIGCVCVAALLINPYGINIITTVVLRTFQSVITKYIFEWKPFTFGEFMGPSLLVLIFIIFSNIRNEKIFIADKISAIIWLIAMFFSVRNVGVLVVLGAPYIAANLPEDNQKDLNTRKLSQWINDNKLSPLLAGFIPAVILASYFILPVLGTNQYLEKSDESPLPAINYVLKNYADKRVLNDWDYGGRIIYETNGKFPVFIDGRSNTVYSEAVLTDYLSFIEMDKDWQKNLMPYNIDVIFMGNKRNFVKDYNKGMYHDSWEQVYHDDVSTVYTRKK